MKNIRLFCTLLILFAVATTYVIAIPAKQIPIVVTQPDGTKINVILKGDEHFHYHTTSDGYLIKQDKKGYYRYAEIDDKGVIKATEIQANDPQKRKKAEWKIIRNLANTTKHINTIHSQRIIKRKEKTFANNNNFPKIGSPKSLVILVNFTDIQFSSPTAQQDFTSMLNTPNYNVNGGTGSAKDYFINNSNHTFSPDFVVVGPYDLPHSSAFYGTNDAQGNDQNPAQMIVDACQIADESGINFSQYDIDNNGMIDNVFVYYAGHNEAQSAPSTTIWPHKWEVMPKDKYGDNGNYDGTTASITFDRVQLHNYACTSELDGNRGTRMCGIGTFVHEFGHVLGLPDFYPTNGEHFFTLDEWDVMDYGPYLNDGRTPPAYSSFERFSLGYLTPKELINPQNDTLPPLTTSNKAYMITKNGNHNLNATNPSPSEFILLENRQKIGWDKYLPGEGMLITHVVYNQSAWDNNSPNNNKNALGVKIIAADGIYSSSTMAGDPFPGTSGIDNYRSSSRSGDDWDKPIEMIRQQPDRNITFIFRGGADILKAPIATEPTDITANALTAHWETSEEEDIKGYLLTAYSIEENGHSTITQTFDAENKYDLIAWNIVANDTLLSEDNKAKKLLSVGNFIETEPYPTPLSGISFYLKSEVKGNNKSNLKVEGWNGKTWKEIATINATEYLSGGQYHLDLEESKGFFKIKISFQLSTKTTFIVDNITTKFSKKLDYAAHEKFVDATNDTLNRLIPNATYTYKVRAFKEHSDYIQFSDFSNKITTKTPKDKTSKALRIYTNTDNSLEVILPYYLNNYYADDLYVYNLLGRIVRYYPQATGRITITGLKGGQLYIIKNGSQVVKHIVP